MMRDQPAIRGRRLRAPDIQATEDLHRIVIDNLAVKALRKEERKIGFSRCGRTDYRKERMHRI
jgi:hypothetical protein